ncbi:MBL fold metallo-hydrolase [Candidatus Uhrbacteria bacterium]|nr:MBL fold metallo-hydrolase [Candidatus Uhrbacteria bacterium]
MKLTFHGAAGEVTGSCTHVEVKDSGGKIHNILIDCGMFQGERMCGTKNMVEFGFDPKTIEAIFVTHPHADHTGRLPKIVNMGFAGPVYMTLPACALTSVVLEDARHIMEENTKRCGDPQLYTAQDVEKVATMCKGINYHQEIMMAPGIRLMFHDAGHVLGSAYISIEAEGKKIIFSGDVGNDDVPILPDTEPISRADVVVCESTYGNREHEPMAMRRQKLKETIMRTMNGKGMLLIPAFSIERTQELLYELNQILLHEVKTNTPIFLDSPMSIRATEIYRHFKQYLRFDAPIFSDPDRDFFSFPNLRETLTVDESKVINETKNPKIVIAGSGMMTGGRVMHHLTRCLPDAKSELLIIGYQARGTVGRKLYEGAKEVTIYGQKIAVKARVSAIGSFSAHGDKNKLTRWLQPENGKNPTKIFLNHGDPDAAESFATHLRHTLRTEVEVAGAGKEYGV